METKLTLVLDKAVIERAKSYASSKKTSLSKMIEAYLDRITEEETEKTEISPLVKSLSGVLSLPKNHELKKDYGDHLAEKYLNG
jgi:dsDNA-specific endonuclease/ATPase MutS2